MSSYYMIRSKRDGKYWYASGDGKNFVDDYDKAKRFESMAKAQSFIFVHSLNRIEVVGVLKGEE